jgi:hypothetical protein
LQNRFKLRITFVDTLPGVFGQYYFNSGHIEIRRGLKTVTFMLTIVHELCHWILDCFHTSYYSHQWLDYIDSSLCRNKIGRNEAYRIILKLQELNLTHKHFTYFYSNSKLWDEIHSKTL